MRIPRDLNQLHSHMPQIPPLIQYRTVGKQEELASQAGYTVSICVSAAETRPIKLVFWMGRLGPTTEQQKDERPFLELPFSILLASLKK